MLPLASGIAFGPPGLAVAWAGPFGAAVAWMRSPTGVRPHWCRHVGGERTAIGCPRVAFSGATDLAVTWCEDDGGHVAVLAIEDGSVRSGPFALFPNARQTAIATRGRATMVVAVDDEGVVVRRADSAGEIGAAPLVRVVTQRGLDPLVATTELGDGWLVVYSLACERLLGVCVLASGSVRDVRHRISARVSAIHASSAGSSAAVALGYDGADAERVDVALLGADGALRERPHAYIEDLGARYVAPHVHWMESRFVAAAVETSNGALELGVSSRRMATGLSSLPEDVAIGSYAERVVAVAVTLDGGETTLVRASCEHDGGAASIGTMALEPADAAMRMKRSRSRQMLVEAATRVAGPAYRSAESAVTIEAERLEVSLRRAGANARLRIEPDDEDHWRMTLAAWTDEHGDGPAPTPSMVRLVRWVRARVSSNEKQLAAAAQAWAAAVAAVVGGNVDGVDWVAGARAVAVELTTMPSAEAVARALMRAVQW